MPGNPLDNIDALRTVALVMKNGAVFKKDGLITVDGPLNPRPGQRLQEKMTGSPAGNTATAGAAVQPRVTVARGLRTIRSFAL